MFPVYSGKYLSHNSIKNVQKSQMPNKVALLKTATNATVQWLEELIQADRRITIDSIATALGCSHGSAYNIMHDCLKFRKVCTVGAQRTEGSLN
jgi:response regulator of citrate/malate metabolism